MSTLKREQHWRRILRVGLIVLAALGIAIIVRRVILLSGEMPVAAADGRMPPDPGFLDNKALTFAHIIPGFVFLVLAPLQFSREIRSRYLTFHRWSGRLFVLGSYIIGGTAMTMPFILTPIGGVSEGAASVFYAVLFVVSVTMAWIEARRGHVARHREWMIRVVAIGLAVVTIRPIIALFFIFTSLQPKEFFGAAFWIGFTAHAIIAEVWINYTRDQLNRVV